MRYPESLEENPELPTYVVKITETHGSIPPWEIKRAYKNIMRTIVHDGEEYLVLDDLRDAWMTVCLLNICWFAILLFSLF